MLRAIASALEIEPVEAGSPSRIEGAEGDAAKPKAAQRSALPDLLEAVPTGRIVEVSGIARASTGARILAAVQARGEAVAWIAPKSAGLFPPDLAAAGLDLDALVVVHVPEDARAGPKAAELLLRTGAIGAVVLDASRPLEELRGAVIRSRTAMPAKTAWQGRLLGVLREHDARLVILSGSIEAEESLGPLVSVRLALGRRRVVDPETGASRFEIQARVTKDKSGLLGGKSLSLRTARAPRGA